MIKNKQGVLIVGAGLIGSRRAHIVKKTLPKAKIFIFDKDTKRSKALAKEVDGTSLKSLRDGLQSKNIEIIVVAVVNKYAKDICIEALKNGKHVLCEKPLGRNYKEALLISNAANKYKKILKCGFNHRYHPAIQEAYRRKNEIGKILFIRGVYGHGGRKGYEKEWRASKDLCGGGELLDQGCHLVDLALWFLNFEEIKKGFLINKTMFWEMNVEDNAFLLFETKTGKVVQLHASWTQWKNKFSLEIFGTQGSIEINGLGRSYGIETLKVSRRMQLGTAPKITERQFKTHDISWEAEWKDFIKSIKSRKLPMSNHKESLKVMKLVG